MREIKKAVRFVVLSLIYSPHLLQTLGIVVVLDDDLLGRFADFPKVFVGELHDGKLSHGIARAFLRLHPCLATKFSHSAH